MCVRLIILSCVILTLGGNPAALAAKAAPPAPAPAAAAPAPETPQQTTATYDDWTLRCTRSATAAQTCELTQTLANQGRPVAQIALGRVARGQPMHLTILVPISVTFGQQPQMQASGDPSSPLADLIWRRCLPGGCVAETTLTDDALRRLRARAEPSQVVFQDGAGRSVALPFSPHGLPQGLDALGKEDGA